MKIAFLLPGNYISGGLYVAYHHAHYLAKQGHDVTVVFQSDAAGTQVTHFLGFALPVRLLIEVADSEDYFDVVISGWWECYYAMFHIAADHYLHFIQGDDRAACKHHFGSRIAFNHAFIDRAFSDGRIGLIVVAKWLKDLLLEQSSNAQVEYAPNGIDTAIFHPAVRPLVPRGDRVRVLIEGPGGIPFKRVALAFQVALRIPGIDIWYVSGDGTVDPSWKCHRVFRKVRQHDMPAIYASCDILLKLSVVEGFFGPPLEMMACGGTAVVGKVCGYEEYIVDGQNALAVDLDDEEAAFRALLRLAEDRDLRETLSREGIRTAQALDWSYRHPLFEEALHRLMQRVPSMPRAERALYLVLDQLRGQGNRIDGHQQSLQQGLSELRSQIAGLVQGQEVLARDHYALKATLINWKPFRYWNGVRRRVARVAKAGLRALGRCQPLRWRRLGLGNLPGSAAAPSLSATAMLPTPDPSAALTLPSTLNISTLITAEKTVGRRSLARIARSPIAFGLPIAFVGQPEYFRSVYYDVTARGEGYEFPITSADCSPLRRLPQFVKDYGVRACIVFRPEWFAPFPEAFDQLKALGVAVIGYSTEPVPQYWKPAPHPDQLARLESLRKALHLEYDLLIHFDPSSLDLLREVGFVQCIAHPLPVSSRLFYPQDLPREFDCCFLGRSTPHREALLAPLKNGFDTVHVAHGLRDEYARELMNRSRLVLNIHSHNYPNFENRVIQALCCRRPVLSEPLSGGILRPHADYGVFHTAEELRQRVEELLQQGEQDAPPIDQDKFTIDALLDRLAAVFNGQEVSSVDSAA